MAVIYKATNKITGKSYIGFDSRWPNRKRMHLWHAFNSENVCPMFHRSLKKHGKDNFDWEILLEDATLEDEIRLIEEHNTYWQSGRGYNLTKGGDGNLGWIMPEETKKKISEKAKGNKNCLGRVVSEETREKLRKAVQGKPGHALGKPSPLRGRKQSPELIEKRISARMETVRKNKQRVTQGF